MIATTIEATEFLDRFARTWADNDGVTLGRLFTADSSLVNPFGERADGRGAIAEMYSGYFAGLLAGTTTTLTDVRSRRAAPGVLFVDAEQVINDPAGHPLMTVHLSALLIQDGDEWRFADARPFVPAAPVAP